MMSAACKTPPSGAAGDALIIGMIPNVQDSAWTQIVSALAALHFFVITLQLGVIFNNQLCVDTQVTNGGVMLCRTVLFLPCLVRALQPSLSCTPPSNDLETFARLSAEFIRSSTCGEFQLTLTPNHPPNHNLKVAQKNILVNGLDYLGLD